MMIFRSHYQEIGEEGEDLDYSQVDWALISTSVFKGLRSPTSLRLRWMNELSPRWSQESWKKNELAKLKELRENVGLKKCFLEIFSKFYVLEKMSFFPEQLHLLERSGEPAWHKEVALAVFREVQIRVLECVQVRIVF